MLQSARKRDLLSEEYIVALHFIWRFFQEAKLNLPTKEFYCVTSILFKAKEI